MNRYLNRAYKGLASLIVAAVFVLCTGCAPGPPPPIPPALFGAGIGWIVVALLVLGAILLWKNFNFTKPTKTDHLADALNAINDRLTALEEKIDQIEKNKKQKTRRIS